ncbi:hypothetical protein Tco_0771419 [Tanacetum coccineum]|uniref:Uncharacterized protein n=1 Tax=Tanacetum coccineum TaxID=301880 RepID=A0ABQ4ZEZ5_9ASTR
MTLDDFRTIFQLPQATGNNHERFVAAPKFLEMVPLFFNDLGFTLELRSPSNFKTTGLVQLWQRLCKMFARCLTTLVTSYDQPSLQIMQMLYCFVNNVHVDYAEILWEGLHYSLEHPSTLIPYPRFTKLIVGKNKAGVGMKIPSSMITDEMKLTENYRLRDDLEAYQNVEKVNEHLAAEQIEKIVERTENVDANEFVNSILDSQNDPGTRLDPGSYKKSLEVEITDIIQPMNVIEEEDESAEDDYELRRGVKGKHAEESTNTPSPTPIRSPRTHSTLISLDTKKLQELTVTDLELSSSTPSSSSSKPSASQRLLSLFKSKTRHSKEYKSFFDELKGRYHYLFGHLKTAFMPRKCFAKRGHARFITFYGRKEREALRAEFTSQINNAITNQIPSQVDSSVRSYMSNHVLHVHPTQSSKASAQEQQYQLYLTMKDDLQLQQADLPIWLALKIKFEELIANNTSCRSFVIRLRDQDDHQDDAHHEGENSAKRQKTSEHETYVFVESSSDQANKSKSGPSTLISQELVEEISEIVDEAKLRKFVDEMLRQRCTSGDEHQYHIDQMQNFLKNDIVWESRKEILTLPFPQKPTPVVQSCQRDPKAPALSLVNQDLTSRWVDKCVKNFNPYAQYSVEHWKNPHAKIFYIKRQKEPGKPIEEVYSNSKIVQVIKTTGELGHEHKFVTEIIVRRSNGRFSSITKPDYKNLNKNDIEDMYLLCVNGKVDDYAETGLLWSLVLEGLKSYNNDVKYGYVTPSLSKEDAEYLQLFEEEIEERLKHHD